MCTLSSRTYFFLPNKLPNKPLYSLPASGSLTFGLVGLDFANRDEPPTVLFNAAVFFAISLRLASALISAAFLASATFFAAARFFCFNASAFALASAAFFLSAACLANIAARRLFVSIVLPAYACNTAKQIIVFVSQPTNTPINQPRRRKQSTIHIHSRTRARVDNNKLSMRIRQRISRLPAPRARPTPPHSRHSRATYFFASPHALARANPRSHDASNAHPSMRARVRAIRDRTRSRAIGVAMIHRRVAIDRGVPW